MRDVSDRNGHSCCGVPGRSNTHIRSIRRRLAYGAGNGWSSSSPEIESGAAITPALTVAIKDATGNTVTTSSDSITLAIGSNPGSGTLSGTATVTAINGVATFSGLSIDKAGTGYTLTAASGSLTGATSSTFGTLPKQATAEKQQRLGIDVSVCVSVEAALRETASESFSVQSDDIFRHIDFSCGRIVC